MSVRYLRFDGKHGSASPWPTAGFLAGIVSDKIDIPTNGL